MKHSQDQQQGAASREGHVRRDPWARDTSTHQGARSRRHARPATGEPASSGPERPPTPGEDTGPLVRPYTMTRGRTRSCGARLDMISIVMVAREGSDPASGEPEHASILRACRRPISVAEISAQLDLPLAVVKVLLGDLVAEGEVFARDPMPAADLPEMNVLQAVLDGIRKL